MENFTEKKQKLPYHLITINKEWKVTRPGAAKSYLWQRGKMEESQGFAYVD